MRNRYMTVMFTNKTSVTHFKSLGHIFNKTSLIIMFTRTSNIYNDGLKIVTADQKPPQYFSVTVI